MSTVNESAIRAQTEGGGRPSRVTVVGTIALLLAPVAGAAGGTAQYLALGAVDSSADPAGFLEAVSANAGLWNTYCVLLLGMAALTMAWAPAVWRLAVDRSPRWAWAAAVAGILFAMGQMVHLMSWGVLSAALATASPSDAVAILEAVDSQWFFVLIFAPFLLGALLAAPIAAVALRRAQLLRTWSVVVVAAASIAAVVLGTIDPIGIAVYSVLVITGFVPAVVRVLRRRAA